MKCPECERTGQRSKLYTPTGYYSTAMGGTQTYFDEDGHHHHHEVNSSSGRGHCSNGHTLNLTLSTKCQAPNCDYGTPQTITLMPPRPVEPEPSYTKLDNLMVEGRALGVQITVPREPEDRNT